MKVKVWVKTDKVGSTVEKIVEVPSEDYEGLEGFERGQALDEDMLEVMLDMITWNWETIE